MSLTITDILYSRDGKKMQVTLKEYPCAELLFPVNISEADLISQLKAMTPQDFEDARFLPLGNTIDEHQKNLIGKDISKISVTP